MSTKGTYSATWPFYKNGELSRLLEQKHSGPSGKLTTQELAELEAWIDETTPKTTRKLIACVEEEFQIDISCTAITKLFKRLGFCWTKPKFSPGRANDEQQDESLKVYENIEKILLPEDRI